MDPSNFDNAYFEVRSVRVFGSGAEGVDSVIQASGARRRAGLGLGLGELVMTVGALVVGMGALMLGDVV